ncbi:hypothetical protein [Argonema antarcticum]|uniref:hypothetical protein n=1 Tax=Argonema antarcticum TaxID=2942763 RepID=UPI002012A4D5|nr:hypothetical protein [Argonema antarcticum]MCL1471848.1 hypothetical protein [Argonema antarcticum A004/B2]
MSSSISQTSLKNPKFHCDRVTSFRQSIEQIWRGSLTRLLFYAPNDMMSGCIGSVSVMREIVCCHRELNFYHR